MQYATTHGPIDYRNGDWGPTYLLQNDGLDIGIVALRANDAIDNHRHERCHESFVIIEGECTLWINRQHRYTMGVGDIYSCAPGEEHHLINESNALCRLVFLKTPPSPGDTVVRLWTPTAE